MSAAELGCYLFPNGQSSRLFLRMMSCELLRGPFLKKPFLTAAKAESRAFHPPA